MGQGLKSTWCGVDTFVFWVCRATFPFLLCLKSWPEIALCREIKLMLLRSSHQTSPLGKPESLFEAPFCFWPGVWLVFHFSMLFLWSCNTEGNETTLGTILLGVSHATVGEETSASCIFCHRGWVSLDWVIQGWDGPVLHQASPEHFHYSKMELGVGWQGGLKDYW